MRDPDALLQRAGVQGDRRHDQHYLVDDRVLDRLPDYASEFDLEHVLEIGAGTGALTDRLLSVADRVTAIECDGRLASFLYREFRAEVKEDRLRIVEGDAIDVELPAFTASVSNLPYGASSELLFRLLPARRPLVVMVQREFAERMVADPGTSAYGRLTVTAGHYAAAEIVEIVPPEAFEPAPAVESAVVRTTPRAPTASVDDEERFLAFVTAVFTQRRKTMRNAIRNTTHISGIDDPERVIEAADTSLMAARAGELTPADFADLVRIATAEGGDE